MGLIGVPPLHRYIIVALLSAALSVGGVFWAAHIRCPADGGRGGALATALAFIVLFLRPDYGMWIFKHRKEKIPADLSETERLRMELAELIKSLDINSNGQRNQNIALAVASGIGTIFWGFGDLFAKWLM
jgi:hypothetical protein